MVSSGSSSVGQKISPVACQMRSDLSSAMMIFLKTIEYSSTALDMDVDVLILGSSGDLTLIVVCHPSGPVILAFSAYVRHIDLKYRLDDNVDSMSNLFY